MDPDVARRRLGIAAILVLALGVAALTIFSMRRDRDAPDVSAVPPIPVQTGTREIFPVISVIGDSYIGGSDMGGNGRANFIDLLADKQQWTMADKDGRGGSGYVVSDAPFSSPERISALSSGGDTPDVVFVVNGINDVNGMPTAADPRGAVIVKAADSTYSAIQQALPDAKLIVLGYFSPHADRPVATDLNKQLEAVTKSHGGTFIDPIAERWFTDPGDPLIGSDNFHPTDEGHAALSRWVADALREDGGMDVIESTRHRVPCQLCS